MNDLSKHIVMLDVEGLANVLGEAIAVVQTSSNTHKYLAGQLAAMQERGVRFVNPDGSDCPEAGGVIAMVQDILTKMTDTAPQRLVNALAENQQMRSTHEAPPSWQ